MNLRLGRIITLIVIVVIACTIFVYDRLLLNLSTRLVGKPLAGAHLLLSLWWPAFSLRVADTAAVHSYFGAPDLSNHLLDLPIVQSIFFSLLRALSNPLLAANLTLIVSLVLTLSVTVLYLQHRGIPLSGAVLAGAALVLSPWYVGGIERGDVISASLWVVPLAFLLLDRWLESSTPLNGALLVATLYGGILCGVQIGMVLLVLWLPYVSWRLWRMRDDDGPNARHDQLAVMGLVLLGLLLLYPAPPLIRTLLGDEPAYGPLWQPNDRSLFGQMASTSLPIMGAAVVTLLAARQKRRHLPWLVLGGFNLLVGVTALPDPLTMLLGALQIQAAPLAPASFYLGGASFALLVYVTGTWRDQPPIKHVRWGWLAAAACTVIVLGADPAVYHGLAQHGVEVPAFYAQIATEPEDYVVLEYPFGLAGTFDGQTIGRDAYLAQYVVWHHKRTAGSVLPVLNPELTTNVQVEGFLLPTEIDADSTASAAALADAVNRWRIGYVVVRPTLYVDGKAEQIEALLEASGGLCPPVESDGILLYRARWHPQGCEGGS